QIFLADQAADYLAGLRFWEVGHDDDFAGAEGGAQEFDYGGGDGGGVQDDAGLGDGIADDGFAFEVVGNADDGGLGDAGVVHHGFFDFGGADFAAGHVHGFVGAAVQEPVAVFVDTGPIA